VAEIEAFEPLNLAITKLVVVTAFEGIAIMMVGDHSFEPELKLDLAMLGQSFEDVVAFESDFDDDDFDFDGSNELFYCDGGSCFDCYESNNHLFFDHHDDYTFSDGHDCDFDNDGGCCCFHASSFPSFLPFHLISAIASSKTAFRLEDSSLKKAQLSFCFVNFHRSDFVNSSIFSFAFGSSEISF